MRSRMSRASSARRIESSFEVVMTSPVAQGEGGAPALRATPRRRCRRPARRGCSVSSSATSSRCRAVSRLSQPRTLRVGRSCRPAPRGEVGEADLALVPLAVVGDEEQVVGGPGRALGAVGRGALLERHLAQNATQSDDRKPLRLELDEEDAPGLIRRERAQALDLLDLGGVSSGRSRALRP